MESHCQEIQLKAVEVEQSSIKARTQACPFWECVNPELFPR